MSQATDRPLEHINRAELAERLAFFEKIINPIQVKEALSSASVETISDAFKQVRVVFQGSWMSMAVCVGLAQEKAGVGEKVSDELSRVFEMHKSRISRLGKIYREILLPRFEERGSDAEFFIKEISYYEAAADAATRTGKKAIDLLEHAEEQKILNSKYSVRKFRDEIKEEGPDVFSKGVNTLAGEFANKLFEVSEVQEDVLDAFIGNLANPKGWKSVIKKVSLITEKIELLLSHEDSQDEPL